MDLSELNNSSVKAHLANCLALYQRQRDVGAGLTHVTRTQRALRQYYIQQHRANVDTLAGLAFRKGFVEETSCKISNLVKQAESATGDELRRIAAEVDELQKLIEQVTSG